MIKIAVLSDIHGNYVALQKCIEYAINLGVETFVFLGDYVGELAYPQKTMEQLYTLKEKYSCYFIKGNKEDYWLNYKASGEIGWSEIDSTTGSLYYTYHNLTGTDLAFFASLSHKMELQFEQYPVLTICHGSPRKVNEKLLPNDEKTNLIISEELNNYILCGHTHVQGMIEWNGKKVLNAGSVGVSLYGKGKSQFMILYGKEEAWEHEFVSLDYDVDTVIKDLEASGLTKRAPYWCAVSKHMLQTGEISHNMVLTRAMTICQEKYGSCNWPNVPEECWKEAVEEMLG